MTTTQLLLLTFICSHSFISAMNIDLNPKEQLTNGQVVAIFHSSAQKLYTAQKTSDNPPIQYISRLPGTTDNQVYSNAFLYALTQTIQKDDRQMYYLNTSAIERLIMQENITKDLVNQKSKRTKIKTKKHDFWYGAACGAGALGASMLIAKLLSNLK